MTFPLDVSLTANVPAAIDVSADTRTGDILDVRIANSGANLWARADGEVPAAFATGCFANWWLPGDGGECQKMYIGIQAADRTLRVLSDTTTTLRIQRVSPVLNLQKVNRGFGMGDSPEYPQVNVGVSSIVLTGRYRPGGLVRVDFPVTSSTFAVTADGSTPSATNGSSTAYGENSCLVQLSQTSPELSLKVWVGAGITVPVRFRVQKVSAAASPI